MVTLELILIRLDMNNFSLNKRLATIIMAQH